MNDITKNEEILLLTIWRLKEEAYGVAIKSQIKEVTGKEWNYGTLYCALDQLVKKGFLIKTEGQPLPERGGRRKIYYTLSQGGNRALRDALSLKEALWDGINMLALEGRSAE